MINGKKSTTPLADAVLSTDTTTHIWKILQPAGLFIGTSFEANLHDGIGL